MRRRVALLPLLFAAGCHGSEPPLVGVVVSGTAAQAALLAAGEAHGGAVVPVIRTSANPVGADTALHVAEVFASDVRVLAVVGHANSSASLSASQIYNRLGLVQIAPTTTAPLYSRAGPWSFRMVPGDDRQAGFLASALGMLWPHAARVALVHVNDDYGRGFYRELRPGLRGVVFEAIYMEQAAAVHLQELGKRLAAAEPDVLVWLGRPASLGMVLSELQALGSHPHVICGDACDVEPVYRNAAGVFTGVHFVRFMDPSTPTPMLREFMQRFEALTGTPLTSEAVLTHDGVLAVEAAVRSGARTREQVRQFLHSLGRDRPALEGLGGPIAFDENGDLLRPYLLAAVEAQGVRAVALGKR